MEESVLRGVRAVLFDAGNTLVFPDWERMRGVVAPILGELPAAVELQRRVMTVLSRADADPDFLHRLGARAVPRHWHFRLVFQQLGAADAQLEEIVAALDEAHQRRHLWTGPNPDSAPVLRSLRERGLRLGVISNSEDGALDRILRTAGLDGYFDAQVDSFLVGYAKPNARIFGHALAALGVAPEDALFVGDLPVQDCGGARGAGLRAVLFDPHGLSTGGELARIRSLRDLTSPAPRRS